MGQQSVPATTRQPANRSTTSFSSLAFHHSTKMRFTALLAPLGLCASVFADGQAIVDSIGVISSITGELNTAVSSWKGDLLGALPIVGKSTELLKDINNGTKTAKASQPLSVLEAITIAGAIQNLQKSVNTTLTTIIGSKKKFDRLLLSPVILLNLDLEKDASDRLGAAIKAKVPENLQTVAQGLQDTLDGYFDTAIDAYKLFRR